MSVFSTKNSDGASVLAEPTSTVPLSERAKLQRCADRHGCDTVAELVTAPSLNHLWEYSPGKAGQN